MSGKDLKQNPETFATLYFDVLRCEGIRNKKQWTAKLGQKHPIFSKKQGFPIFRRSRRLSYRPGNVILKKY
jgi:hypothetical protein